MQPTTLATRRGRLTLALLCLVAFLDFIDASIVNVALPSIRRDLDFSLEGLQWVPSAYLLTYGGFMLLGGRAGDLLGRRRVLLAGTTLFMLSSLAGGLAWSAEVLVAARLLQGAGAALMLPAALSLLTTTFREGPDRHKALGVWGGMAGLASAAGVFLGGVLSEGPGWRWVMFVNLPVCLIVLVSTVRLIRDEHVQRSRKGFDARGALLVTSGMLALVFTLVEAPNHGWGSARTLGGLAAALLLLAAFVVNEQRARAPLAPLEIFRVNGLGAANVTQLVGVAGMVSMFFFLTLYMQGVLGYSQIQAGAAYLPLCFGVIVAAGVTSQLLSRIGTRPVIVAGALISAAGVYLLSRVPLGGTYVDDLLPGLLVASLGLGTVFVGVTTAANSGVSADKAGLAAALLNTSQQLGAALGLAIFTAIATSRTNDLIASGTAGPEALTSGIRRALLLCSVAIVVSAVIGLRATNARGEAAVPAPEPAAS